MSRKRGKLSTEEENYIRDHVDSMSLHDIAVHINRTEETVNDFCLRNRITYAGMTAETYDDTILVAKLEKRPYWAELKTQLTDVELQYFATTWVRMIKQFREDVLYSEELQIKQWIVLEILSNRVMKERKRSIEQIDRMQTELDRQYATPIENRDVERVAGLETEISVMRNSLSTYTSEHAKILDRIKDVQRDLKAARSDRVKKIEDSKSSWTGLLAALEDESIRARIGEDAQIMKIAKDKAIKDFSDYHTYENGEVDQPFLTPETIKEEE